MGLLEVEAISYIRGRSIPRQYMVVDEAQILQGRLKDSDKLTYYVDQNTWSDSAFQQSPYTVMVEVNDDILNTNTVLFYYKELPSLGVQRTISNELEKNLELAKLQGENIDEEAYRRVRKPLVMKLFDRNGPSGWYSHAWISRADQSLSKQKPAM